MKAKEMMDKDFIYVNADDSIEDISIKMENIKRFTTPVLDENMKLIGWITSLDITKGLRENKKLISEVMSLKKDVKYIYEDDPSRLAVLEASRSKLICIPVFNHDDVVTGLIYSLEIVDILSKLYDIKIEKIYRAIDKYSKEITWNELMEASSIIYRK
ncbi:MAG: CBS domain-containing protein, partial [Methanobrevibacter sp.]|nr:CBS domain-containing protein [Candidatus Methanovirga basalitermitum]